MPEKINREGWQFKGYDCKVEIDDDERTITAIISTDIVDRDDEVMKPNGVDLEGFMKNPVVLWAHDYHSPSIGKALWVTKSRKNVKAKTKFAETPRAEEIYQLYKGGYLKGFSVGFIPKESHKPEPKEIEKRPELSTARSIIDKWELLEFSAVPVPANPEALATAVKTKEITVSKKLQTELGLDDTETFYPVDEDKYFGGQIDSDYKLEPILKPEETENYIRIPVRNCKVTATITISAKEGIKALYCGKIKKVRTYLFDKEKGWTMAKAKAWVKEHDSGKDAGICNVSIERIPMCVKGINNIPMTVTNTVPVKIIIDYSAKVIDAIKRRMGRLN